MMHLNTELMEARKNTCARLGSLLSALPSSQPLAPADLVGTQKPLIWARCFPLSSPFLLEVICNGRFLHLVLRRVLVN